MSMSALVQRFESSAGQPQAEVALFGLGVAEGFCLLSTTDRLLMPMVILEPEKAVRYALVATAGCVLGGILAFILGVALFKLLVAPFAVQAGYAWVVREALAWFDAYGPMALLAAGFSPLPVTGLGWISGALHGNLLVFALALGGGRFARHGVIAWLIWRGGARMQEWLERNFFGLSMLMALGVLLMLMVAKLVIKYM